MQQNYENIYIQDFIIYYLERLTQGQTLQNNIPWLDMYDSLKTCIRKSGVYMSALHRMMLPFYDMYLFADSSICKHDHPESRLFVEHVAEADQEFAIWASSQDIISATECWGEFLKRKRDGSVSYYFRLLRILIHGKFYKNWLEIANELEEVLFNSETNSDYKTGELFCILHATSRIMLQDWNIQKKHETFELLINHWDFLKNFYSVMIRRIIGSRLANFAALTNNVVQTNENHPHAHIYYCALMERMESFRLTVKQYKSLDNAKERLRTEVLDKTKPSEVLYEICDTLFPKEFQIILRDYRPKSYDEVANENSQKEILLKQMEVQNHELNERIIKIARLLRQMVESSISMEEIEAELMKYPPGIAWEMLDKLNSDLSWNPVWRDYYPKLREKLCHLLYEPIVQQKDLTDAIVKVAERPTYGSYYAAGSTHDDKRNQVHLKKKTDQDSQIKQLGNE